MNLLFLGLLVLLASSAKSQDQEGDPITAATFAKVLRSLTMFGSGKSCAGVCYSRDVLHICSNVDKSPGLCPLSTQFCCVKTRDQKNLDNAEDALVRDDIEQPPPEQVTSRPGGLSTWSDINQQQQEDVSVTLPTITQSSSPSSQTPEVKPSTPEEVNSGEPSAHQPEEKEEVPKPSTEQPTSTSAATEPDSSDLVLENREASTEFTGTVCPGVCVAERISDHCEAALDVAGLCKNSLRCCVSHSIFEGEESVPKEFVLIRGPSGSKDNIEAGKESQVPPELSNEVTKKSNDEATPTPPQRPRPTPASSVPEHLRCQGTCVASFFSFLCDEVDRNAVCPRNGRCCLTQRKKNRTPPETSESTTPASTFTTKRETTPTTTKTTQTTSRPTTTTTEITTTTTTTTTTPTTTTATTLIVTTSPSRTPPEPVTLNSAASVPNCPGTCIPVNKIRLCREPSYIITLTKCREQTVCCDDREAQKQWKLRSTTPSPSAASEDQEVREPEKTETRRPRPERPQQEGVGGLVPQAFQSLANFFMSSNDRPSTRPPNRRRPPPPHHRRPGEGRPRPPPPPPAPTTTTTTTTTTTLPPTTTTEMPGCPGTCIVPLLSFTCFGNAELTDIFACDRSSQKCCAPKSAIRDIERLEVLSNPEQNLTTFQPGPVRNPNVDYSRLPHIGHERPFIPQHPNVPYQYYNPDRTPVGRHPVQQDHLSYNQFSPDQYVPHFYEGQQVPQHFQYNAGGHLPPPHGPEYHQFYQHQQEHNKPQLINYPNDDYPQPPHEYNPSEQIPQDIQERPHMVSHLPHDANQLYPQHQITEQQIPPQPSHIPEPPPPPLQQPPIVARPPPHQQPPVPEQSHQPPPIQRPPQPSVPRPHHPDTVNQGPPQRIDRIPPPFVSQPQPDQRVPVNQHSRPQVPVQRPQQQVPTIVTPAAPPKPQQQQPLPQKTQQPPTPPRSQRPQRPIKPTREEQDLRPHYVQSTAPPSPTTTALSVADMTKKSPSVGTSNKYVCGVKGSPPTRREGRVVGGEDALPGEWCWQVALINSQNQYLCGGALIGTQWVLTAAHCVTNIVRSGDSIYVRVGDHDLTTRFGSPGAQTLRVATTYIHHNHNSQTLDNDIALLKLSGHSELKKGVCLICLPARGVSQVAGKRCTVTGYGYMGETGPIPLRVREAEVPIVSENECVRKINAVTEKIFILPASSFCAGGESGHDACQGDGGGPLVCEVDGYYEVSGLVSWGFGCGRHEVPGVYVKVASFIGWINQIISVNNHT